MTSKVSPSADILRNNRGENVQRLLKTSRAQKMGHVKIIPEVLEQGNHAHVSP